MVHHPVKRSAERGVPRRVRRLAGAVLPWVMLGVLLTACHGAPSSTPPPLTGAISPHPSVSSSPPAASPTPEPQPSPSTAARRSPSPTHTAVGLPAYSASTSRLTAADLPHSWRAGCPVGPSALRAVHLTYVGFDGRAHHGTLVVNADQVDAVVHVFRRLYADRFPIRSIIPIDAFGASDERSTEADNTAGFNCRKAVGGSGWSQHAFGHAIDINPVENPYIEGSTVLPPAGSAYLDRSRYRAGMVLAASRTRSAFAAFGWRWGGTWSTPDYQHFSTTGT